MTTQPTSDEDIQASVKSWITQKVANGWKPKQAFKEIIKNYEKGVRQLGEQIEKKKAALAGVSTEEVETALGPYYVVARREERIFVNAKAVKDSGWKPPE